MPHSQSEPRCQPQWEVREQKGGEIGWLLAGQGRLAHSCSVHTHGGTATDLLARGQSGAWQPGGERRAGAGHCRGPAGRWTRARRSRPVGRVSPRRARLRTADPEPRPAGRPRRFLAPLPPGRSPARSPSRGSGPLLRHRGPAAHLPSTAPPQLLSSPQPRCGPTGGPAESEDAAARRGAGGRAPTHLSAGSGRREPQGAAPQPHHAATQLCIEDGREAGARRWMRRRSREKTRREPSPPRTTAV